MYLLQRDSLPWVSALRLVLRSHVCVVVWRTSRSSTFFSWSVCRSPWLLMSNHPSCIFSHRFFSWLDCNSVWVFSATTSLVPFCNSHDGQNRIRIVRQLCLVTHFFPVWEVSHVAVVSATMLLLGPIVLRMARLAKLHCITLWPCHVTVCHFCHLVLCWSCTCLHNAADTEWCSSWCLVCVPVLVAKRWNQASANSLCVDLSLDLSLSLWSYDRQTLFYAYVSYVIL